jgi:leucyl aminopeptidase
MISCFAAPDAPTTPVHAIAKDRFEAFLSERPAALRAIVQAHEFKAQAGRVLLVTGPDGGIERVLFGLGTEESVAVYGALAAKLPEGDYRLATPPSKSDAQAILTAFALGTYVFDRYKTKSRPKGRLQPPAGADPVEAMRIANAVAFGRDLVNTPAGDLGPDALEAAARETAAVHGAHVEVIAGDALLDQNYPLIHAVGRAASQAPRLVILRHNRDGLPADAPRLAIVGKGVTFDSGGLNMKPGAGMALMKKDMGGAACALALFQMVVQAKLNVRLSVYLPIVENAIAGNAMRPSDVVSSRKGFTVEIDNTDAEGRLILADAITRASEDGADLILDLATLTGAARVALGPELPPFFTDNEALAEALHRAAKLTGDHLWRMPLWAPYEDELDSQIADIKNSGGPFAGAINGALFIKRFVSAPAWCHFDVYCWNPKDKPGRPQGGEVHAVRAIDAMLRERFGTG